MRGKYTIDEVKEYIQTNNIRSRTELKNRKKGYWNYCKNHGLWDQMGLPPERVRVDINEVDRFIRDNNITSLPELRRLNRKYYDYMYNHCLTIDFEDGVFRRCDINKVWSYLVRWADEEGTTIREQAFKYGYGKQYNEYCEKVGDPDLNREKYLPEVFQEFL